MRMDHATAEQLNELTSTFYQTVEASFSATRQSPWRGWSRVRDLARELDFANPSCLRVLDLACGNLRFERYLAAVCKGMQSWAVDSCDELSAGASDVEDVTYQHLDIVKTLLEGRDLTHAIEAPPCDLTVCFGFMHHVALPEHRSSVLKAMLDHTRSGGYAVASFWQFARDQRLLSKARPLADEGDYLLGWQNQEGVLRYCHSYSTSEIDCLVDSVSSFAHLKEQYLADGKTGNLNCYVVLQRS